MQVSPPRTRESEFKFNVRRETGTQYATVTVRFDASVADVAKAAIAELQLGVPPAR